MLSTLRTSFAISPGIPHFTVFSRFEMASFGMASLHDLRSWVKYKNTTMIMTLKDGWKRSLVRCIIIIWLAPRAGKMSQILCCDWPPKRARWSYLACSGLPVARPLGINSLIPRSNAIFSSIFCCSGGKC